MLLMSILLDLYYYIDEKLEDIHYDLNVNCKKYSGNIPYKEFANKLLSISL